MGKLQEISSRPSGRVVMTGYCIQPNQIDSVPPKPRLVRMWGQTRHVGAKKSPADDADFTADKILIRIRFGFDPDFICVKICIATHEFLRSLRKFSAVWPGLDVRAKNPP